MPGVAIVMKNQVGEEVETCVESAGASCDQHNSNKSSMAVGGGMAMVGELQTAHSNARINVCDFNLLHNYFLHMFESSEETNPVKEKAKRAKSRKNASVRRGVCWKDLEGSFRYPLAREGVTAPGGPAFLAHTKQKVNNIVDLTVLRLAFFMGYE